MRLAVLTKRYADALFRAAFEADPRTGSVVDMVESDLGLVSYSLESVPELTRVLTQPLIPIEHKQEIIRKVFGGRVQDLTLRFLELILKKRRESILPGLEQEYIRLANEYRGIIGATVTSAVPITEDEKRALQEKLESMTQRKVEIRFEQDAELIGGLTVRIGDTVIDGSVRGYLTSLRERLLGGRELHW